MTYGSGVRGFRGSTKVMQYVELSKLGWASTAVSLASLMLLTDSADAQQPAATLPAIEVNPPPRQRTPSKPKRRAQPAPAVVAPVAEISAPQERAVGAGVQGYGPPAQSASSRYPVPFLNTPQTVNVVTQQLIQDQRATSLQDALRNVPGITFTAGEGGIQGDNITIRGYSARNDIYRDGIRDPGWYYRDTFAIDRVEVYKGPSSFLFGRGSTGGVINIISKLPQYRDFTAIDGMWTSADGARTTVDVNRTWGDWAARVVAMGYNTDVADRDFTNTKRYGVAPSVSYKINELMKNTLSYIYQHDNIVPDRGIPMIPGSYFGTSYRQPTPVPRNTYYGSINPNLPDTETTDAHILNNRFDYDISKGVKFTNITGYQYVDRFNRTRATQINTTTAPNLFTTPTGNVSALPLSPATNLANVWIANANHFQNQTTNQLVSNVADLNLQFATGTLQHNVLMGLETSFEKRDNFRINVNDFARINLINPDPSIGGTWAPTQAVTSSNSSDIGIYGQDQIKVTDWLELLGGVRFDNYRANADSYTLTTATGAIATPLSLNANNNFTSYRAGIVLHPTSDSSVYYMRGTSANPPAEFTTITNGQQALTPVMSTIDEVGAKAEFLNKKVTATAAIFRIHKEGDYENQGTAAVPFYVPIGNTEVKGFEAGITGQITAPWAIYAGYTLLNSEVVSSLVVTNIGHQLGMTPQNSFSIYSTYDITSQFTIGGGAFYVELTMDQCRKRRAPPRLLAVRRHGCLSRE